MNIPDNNIATSINLIDKDRSTVEVLGIIVASSLEYTESFYNCELDSTTKRCLLNKELETAKELVFNKHNSFKY